MKGLKAFDYQNCTLKERQFHYTSFGFLMGLCLLRVGATLGGGDTCDEVRRDIIAIMIYKIFLMVTGL